MILIDDLKKTIDEKDYWLTSHYDPQEEMKDVVPKNSWLRRKEVIEDDK